MFNVILKWLYTKPISSIEMYFNKPNEKSFKFPYETIYL